MTKKSWGWMGGKKDKRAFGLVKSQDYLFSGRHSSSFRGMPSYMTCHIWCPLSTTAPHCQPQHHAAPKHSFKPTKSFKNEGGPYWMREKEEFLSKRVFPQRESQGLPPTWWGMPKGLQETAEPFGELMLRGSVCQRASRSPQSLSDSQHWEEATHMSLRKCRALSRQQGQGCGLQLPSRAPAVQRHCLESHSNRRNWSARPPDSPCAP